METLVNRCRRLVAVTKTDYVRDIYNHINWNCRLLSIRGARGVGKTTLMLQYLKLHDIDYRSMLYVSLDSHYFTRHTLLEFAELFYQRGGKHLFVDEVHKYQGWSSEVKEIYDSYPDMKVVISGSSLLDILNADADLSRRCVPYEMQGLSYREYLAMMYGIQLPAVTLLELLSAPEAFCERVNAECRPLVHFEEYLRQGYYPFILEGEREYPIRVENVVNFILDVELPQLCGVDVSNIRKVKGLLTVLASNVPFQLDMTKLSAAAGMARTTLLSYLQVLHRSRLLNLLYAGDDSVKKMQKPDKIYLENPNLIEVLSLTGGQVGTIRETFVVNQLCYGHQVEYAKAGDLWIDKTYTIEIGGRSKEGKQVARVPDAFIAADGIEYAFGNKIPLWAFGFLY